jgi:phage terminase large subunit-like protein
LLEEDSLLDEGDDWHDEAVWQKANPLIDVRGRLQLRGGGNRGAGPSASPEAFSPFG